MAVNVRSRFFPLLAKSWFKSLQMRFLKFSLSTQFTTGIQSRNLFSLRLPTTFVRMLFMVTMVLSLPMVRLVQAKLSLFQACLKTQF